MTRAEYAPTSHATPEGGVVSAVAPDSPAQAAGIVSGDRILSVDGTPIADLLDWQWHTDGDSAALEVAAADGTVRTIELTRGFDEPWGISFADALFDGVRTCRNNCAFCFMTQLPKGLRKALYLRDDDYRLSFLQGNFVTLTNLSDDDVARIAEQQLTPLYVSVHAVSPSVRAELVCAKEDRALQRIDELLEAGIDLHVQIVLVPGVNDAEELDTTLAWLAEREGIVSVGIVPLGYTRHQERFSASYGDQIAAATVIQQVQRWQFESKARDGVSWVHLADEFYLNARAPFPTAEWYDGFPQYENGIGIVRTFVDEVTESRPQFEAAIKRLPADAESVTIVTGVMAANTLAGALNACDAAGCARLLAVPNRFFGGNVSVTGLLTGGDLAAAIASDRARLESPSVYLLPDIVFNSDGLTLDDMTLDDLVRESGAEVRVVSSDAAGLLAGLTDVAERPPATS